MAVPSLDIIDGFEGDKYGQDGIKATVSPSGEEFPVSDGSPNLLINKVCIFWSMTHSFLFIKMLAL